MWTKQQTKPKPHAAPPATGAALNSLYWHAPIALAPNSSTPGQFCRLGSTCKSKVISPSPEYADRREGEGSITLAAINLPYVRRPSQFRDSLRELFVSAKWSACPAATARLNTDGSVVV